ncbi:MAG: hypothetical protein AAF797_17790 [Planctomycetota bacterium]
MIRPAAPIPDGLYPFPPVAGQTRIPDRDLDPNLDRIKSELRVRTCSCGQGFAGLAWIGRWWDPTRGCHVVQFAGYCPECDHIVWWTQPLSNTTGYPQCAVSSPAQTMTDTEEVANTIRVYPELVGVAGQLMPAEEDHPA